jgi:hypothetical protein
MRRFSIFAVAVTVIVAMAGGTDAQIKNVLLEQHTGAWCGWCPDGSVKMDEILGLSGGQVIGVKIHNGDAMALSEQTIIGNTLGLTGFPTASVDRKSFGGSVFLNRGDWKASCQAHMQQRAKAEVDCFYTLDRATRTVQIQVVVNIAEAMDFPLKFNAFIVEDDVTGTGSGYDQKNYLSGLGGYEGNPYYTQPSVLVGYHHMKVVRRMLGGSWGVAGRLPTSVKAGGSYTHTFTSTLDAKWNMDKLWFVGMVQADAQDNKEIINSAEAVKDGSLLNRIIDSNAPAARALTAGSDFANTYTLENATDKEQTYTVTLSTTDRTPADWSAQFASGATSLAVAGTQPAGGQIVVPAHSTAQLSLTLKAGSALGLGDAQVVLELQGTPTVKRARMVSGISREIKHLLLETGSEYSLRPYLSNTACADAVTLDPGDYLTFANELTDVNMVIWNKGPSGGLSAEEMKVIKNAQNVPTFLCGDNLVGTLTSNDLGYFGLERIGWNLEGVAPTFTVWLSGQDGDVITGNLGGSIEGHLISYYINMVKITDAGAVFPIMHFQKDGRRRFGNATYNIPAQDTIFAVRSTKDNTKTVLLGISPYVIANQQTRRTLVSNIINWLAQ